MPTMIPLLQSWCLEAADQFGDDFGRVQQYVNGKIATLSGLEREKLSQEAAIIFAADGKARQAIPH